MKIILKDSDQVKEVSYGYAVNYLLPQGLAETATKEKLKQLAKKQEQDNKKLKLEKQEDQALAGKLTGLKIKIAAKAGKAKKIHGSIGKKEILQELQVDPKRVGVMLEKPLKTIGLHQVELKIGDQKAKITVEISQEK
jgi:large subunit ribosomal protein L9